MKFSDVISDIKKLVGIELQSIRPGAEITVLDVDEEKGCLLLKTKQGKVRSRPLSELKIIWVELSRKPAVHVDLVLHGSGTSRNQPETIFANLPYIEWVKINNKKHIAFVGENTHAYGTLRQMDALDVANIENDFEAETNTGAASIVVITPDASSALNYLSSCLSGSVTSIENGAYKFVSSTVDALIVLSSKVRLPVGCYSVLPHAQTSAHEIVTICGKEFFVIAAKNGMNLLMKKL